MPNCSVFAACSLDFLVKQNSAKAVNQARNQAALSNLYCCDWDLHVERCQVCESGEVERLFEE